MKRVRNFVTLCGGRYTLGLKLNEAQATSRLVSVRFFYGASPYLSYGSFRPGSEPEWFLSPQMIQPGTRGFLFAREERRKENFCEQAEIKFYRTTHTTWSVIRLKEDWNWSVLVEYVWRRASESRLCVRQHRGKTSTHALDWAFPVTFSVTLSSQIKVSRAHSASFCVQLVDQLFCFMLLLFLTIL